MQSKSHLICFVIVLSVFRIFFNSASVSLRSSPIFIFFPLTRITTELLLGYPKPPFRDPGLSHKLYPGMKSFRQWVKENRGKLFSN